MLFFFIGLILFFQLLLCIIMLIMVYWLLRGVFGVPWIRSKKNFSKAMLDLAGVNANDVVVDYGCGDGSIVIHAAKEYGARGSGFEHLYMIILLARLKAFLNGVTKNVTFYHKNFFKLDKLPAATVVCSYLYPEVNAKLEPLLLRDYPAGTRVVSRTFLFPTLPLKATKRVEKETIYLYEIP